MRRLLPLFVALRAASCLRSVPGVRVPRVVRRAPVALGAGSSEGLLPAESLVPVGFRGLAAATLWRAVSAPRAEAAVLAATACAAALDFGVAARRDLQSVAAAGGWGGANADRWEVLTRRRIVGQLCGVALCAAGRALEGAAVSFAAAAAFWARGAGAVRFDLYGEPAPIAADLAKVLGAVNGAALVCACAARAARPASAARAAGSAACALVLAAQTYGDVSTRRRARAAARVDASFDLEKAIDQAVDAL